MRSQTFNDVIVGRVKRFVLVFLLGLSVVLTVAAQEMPQTPDAAITPEVTAEDEAAVQDSDSVTAKKVSSTLWIKQLIQNGFHINEPGVDYPKFPRFLLSVYNWGDKAFNHYDSTYVVSTGKNWKLLGKSYNWMENYALIFPKNNLVHIASDIYSDIGGYLSFMAVSVGYMFNANELIGHHERPRSQLNFNFTCSRFNLDYTYTSTRGSAHLRRFGKFRPEGMKFDGVANVTTSFTAHYFFNHNHYSHAAAYCFSKYQLKSAGSWIAGFAYTKQSVDLDFTKLPEEVFQALPDVEPLYSFHYTDYMLSGGYGKNWVLHPRRWLINLTGTLGAGYKHTRQNNTDGKRDMIATDLLASFSVVYNHRALFVAGQGHFTANFYFDRKYTFVNALNYLQLIVGMRF